MSAAKGVAVSVARTAAAALAGWLIAWGAARGLGLNESLRAPLAGLIFAGFTVAYHTLVRLAEAYLSPKLGWALGIAKQPVYPPPAQPAVSATGITFTGSTGGAVRLYPPKPEPPVSE